MAFSSVKHSFQETGKFSSLILDYLDDQRALRSLHQGLPSVASIKEAIERRQSFPTDRKLLHEALCEQYTSVEIAPPIRTQLDSLLDEKTYTITTAHQCNVFLGPLYAIFKTLHTIRIAQELNDQLPDHHFVPVFYMGSEDADIDELNHIHLMGEKLEWQTTETGAVGRMRVDDNLLRLIDRQSQLLSTLPYGSHWIDLISRSYIKDSTLADASFRLLNFLFADRGLIVLQPDRASLKNSMRDLFWEELTTGKSAAGVEYGNAQLLELGYEPQAHARPINLFYLKEGLRARIEKTEKGWGVANTSHSWDEAGLQAELNEHPERFSPNVILRGVYQETILPNLLYVGGGGELAYWLQLKQVFDSYSVPFPLLQLRASLQWMDLHAAQKLQALGLNQAELFQSPDSILEGKLDDATRAQLNLNDFVMGMEANYGLLATRAATIDPTLQAHVESLRAKAIQKIEALEKKMARAQRRKMSDQRTQIDTLQRAVFPGSGLQERWENIGYYYAQYGPTYIDLIYDQLEPFGRSFFWLVEKPDQSN
jgi:bacillithiol biosynthesis cysteine-adding enzyme BshC